jgi:predicted dehydrogenase
MQGAIIGFGAIAIGHMTGYSRLADASIVAVADVSQARREYAENTFGLRAYGDSAEMIAREQLDFIDICAPPNTHSEYSILGLAHGLHVLCEKPVFMPGQDGYSPLLDMVWTSGRVFYPCHVYKFAPILESMRQLITAPGFGRVLSANFRILRHGHAVGVPEWEPDWRRERQISGGGILRDHGPHTTYLAMNLTGGMPVSVSCLLGSLMTDRYPSTEDTAFVRIRCTDGIEVALTLSWACGFRDTGYSITGSGGTVMVHGDELSYTVAGDVVTTTIESGFDDPSHKEWFQAMLRDFVGIVASPARQAALIQEALVTSLVIDGAYASAEDGGRWVDIRIPAPTGPYAG